VNLYEHAKQLGALQDPQIRQQITTLVGQIAYLSEVTDDVSSDALTGTIAPSNFIQGLTETIAMTSTGMMDSLNPASSLSNTYSANICQTDLSHCL
jgi:hypothetical protein